MLSDSGPAKNIAYAYNHNGRLKSVTDNGTLKGSYVYNALEQLAARTLSNRVPFGTLRMVYDRAGHLIAETNDSGATLREYVWMNERPVAVIDDVDTASPKLYFVHVDHLERRFFVCATGLRPI